MTEECTRAQSTQTVGSQRALKHGRDFVKLIIVV